MITDAQVHLWEADGPRHPWAPGSAPHLPEPMTAERFLPIMDEVGVDRLVIALPAVAGFDPGSALECAAAYPDRIAVMGQYDADDPMAPDRLRDVAQTPGMVGMRLGLGEPRGSRWWAMGLLDPLWAAAERHDVPISMWSPAGVPGMDAIVARHPGLRLIVDHCNLPGSEPAEYPERVAQLTALARYPNVAVKVSSLPRFSSESYPFHDIHWAIRTIHEAFGPRRMLWGSDQTMMMAHGRATYRESVDLIRVAAAEFLSSEDIDWILGRSLVEWLRWPEAVE